MAKGEPACATDGCYKANGVVFSVLLVIGIALVASVIASTPTDKGCGINCDGECLHDDGLDEFRKQCCDGLEDCGARVAKWFTGLILLILSIIVLIIVASCMCSPCCRKETKEAPPASGTVVQAQAVEVSLQPNTTV